MKHSSGLFSRPFHFYAVTLGLALLAGTIPDWSRAELGDSKLIKEDGAVYVEELLDRPLTVQVVKPTAVYSNLTAERWLGNLLPGRKAELLAISEKAYRVRGQAKQGQVAGWVSKSAIEGIDADTEKKLVLFYERQLLVQDLIANNQVALGMTVPEVQASLGKPDARNSMVDKEGRKDVLEYISYERVPQTSYARDRFGQLIQTTVYIKVPTGKVSLSFENELVASIEESEGAELAGGGNVRIVPPPILIY